MTWSRCNYRLTHRNTSRILYNNPRTHPIKHRSPQSLHHVSLGLLHMEECRNPQKYHQRNMTEVEHTPALLQRALYPPRLYPTAFRNAPRPRKEKEQHRREYRNHTALDIQVLNPLSKQGSEFRMAGLHEKQHVKCSMGQQERRDDYPAKETVVRRQRWLRNASQDGKDRRSCRFG